VVKLIFILLLLFSLPALAQQVDPRYAVQMVQALQAQVAFQQALMKATVEDAEAQKSTLWEWLIEAKKVVK
jgi:hypothetical protein